MIPYTDKPEECDACGHETPDLVECDAYARTPGHGPFTPEADKARAWMCHVCRATLNGNAYCYPRSGYENDALVFRCIAQATNLIFDAIRAKHSEPLGKDR